MIGSLGRIRIYAYCVPVDLRKHGEGLSALVRDELGCDPLSGSMYLFTNKLRTLAKENENLHQRLKEPTEENATLKGETGAEQLGFELALIKEKTDRLQKLLFGDSSERRGAGSRRDSVAAERAGHGPHRQEKLAVEPVAVTIAPGDDICRCCGKPLVPMHGIT